MGPARGKSTTAEKTGNVGWTVNLCTLLVQWMEIILQGHLGFSSNSTFSLSLGVKLENKSTSFQSVVTYAVLSHLGLQEKRKEKKGGEFEADRMQYSQLITSSASCRIMQLLKYINES